MKGKVALRHVNMLWAALPTVAAVMLVSIFAGPEPVRILWLAVIFAVDFALFLIYEWQKGAYEATARGVLAKEAEKIDRYVNAGAIPTAVTNVRGKIIFSNRAFSLIEGQNIGRDILKLIPQLSKPDKDKKINIGGKGYIRETIHTEYGGREYSVYRFIDKDRVVLTTDLCETVMAAVCHIQVDNFFELISGAAQNMQMEIEAEIERVISRQAEKINAAYQRYDRNKYILTFERRHIAGLVAGKFAILGEVRSISTGQSNLVPTLSLGLGVGNSPAVANAEALKAVEMALGRGGDQAVTKDEDGYKFFGGIQQGRERRAKVKTRMFATALRNLMEQCDSVIIMGHSLPDLDCMGASLGILACARRVNKRANIVLDNPNVSIEQLVLAIKSESDYKNVFVTPDDAQNLMSANTMLIVVDTQIAGITIAPALIKQAATIVVIDHHVRGTDYIENPALILSEPYASSTCEMVAEIMQYFSENIVLKPIEVESLLAGIAIDTKGFTFKTGVRTFEAASYLRKMGADTAKIRQLFQDDLKTYTARARVVESAQMIDGGIAIAVCPPEVTNPQLLAAQAADALIGIRGIGASFVLSSAPGETLISGRSIGTINVQRILEKLGGGGHATIAGAQLKNTGIGEAIEQLKEKIKEYESEV